TSAKNNAEDADDFGSGTPSRVTPQVRDPTRPPARHIRDTRAGMAIRGRFNQTSGGTRIGVLVTVGPWADPT
ncbi:hypothetical protein MTO96_038561, partial [Rhipicephalus appendiculatus]